MARVFVPFAMRKLVGGKPELEVPGATLRELIDNLEEMFPGTKERLVEDGALKPGLAAIVGQQPTREGLRAKLDDDTEVHFLPSISGGETSHETKSS